MNATTVKDDIKQIIWLCSQGWSEDYAAERIMALFSRKLGDDTREIAEHPFPPYKYFAIHGDSLKALIARARAANQQGYNPHPSYKGPNVVKASNELCERIDAILAQAEGEGAQHE